MISKHSIKLTQIYVKTFSSDLNSLSYTFYPGFSRVEELSIGFATNVGAKLHYESLFASCWSLRIYLD